MEAIDEFQLVNVSDAFKKLGLFSENGLSCVIARIIYTIYGGMHERCLFIHD